MDTFMRTKHVSLIFCGIQELFVLLAFVTFLVTMTGCDNNAGASTTKNNSPQTSSVHQNNTIDLQSVLNDAVKSKDAKTAGITGIPLTFQCNGVNNNLPLVLSSGKISNEPNAIDLPSDAIYQIGSSTKSFTAVVALQLESEGFFGANGLGSTIGEVLNNPKPTPLEPWNTEWNKITLRQLLNMTSGIPNYIADAFAVYQEYPYRPFSTNDLISFVVDKQPDFQPGQGWHYSNTNYIIMNKIISYVTHRNLKELITTRIFNTLKFTHTYYIEDIPAQEINPLQQQLLMSGYVFGLPDTTKPIHNGVDIKPYSLSVANAAGAIVSNTAEMSIYVRALFKDKSQGGLLGSKQLAELKDLVSTESGDNYKAGEHIVIVDKETKSGLGLGYGLGIMEYFVQLPDGNHFNYYSHGGDTFGFDSNWMYQENKQAYTSYVFNSMGSGLRNVRVGIESEIFAKISNECIAK